MENGWRGVFRWGQEWLIPIIYRENAGLNLSTSCIEVERNNTIKAFIIQHIML